MDKKKPKLKFIGANVPDDIYNKICARAAISGRSMSKEILFIIKERLEQK